MAEPKTPADYRIIIYRELRQAKVESQLISQIIDYYNEGMTLAAGETVTHIVNTLDGILQPDQVYSVMQAFNVCLSDLSDHMLARIKG